MESFSGILAIASGEECKADGRSKGIFSLDMVALCPWGGEFGLCACWVLLAWQQSTKSWQMDPCKNWGKV